MKIRNGFVSNSSSSSFIISDQNFPTVRSLAIYMLNQQIKERRYERYSNKWIKYDKQYIKNLEKIDENQPVSFPSCNYDTYIRKVGDCYLVATCNNTDWDLDDYSTRLSDEAKKELNEIKNYYNEGTYEHTQIMNLLYGNSYYSEFSSFGKDFYDLNKKIIGVETFDNCPKCQEYMWNTPKFGKICLNCNPYFHRKDKLNIINKTEENE